MDPATSAGGETCGGGRTLLRVEAIGLLILLIVLFAAFRRSGTFRDRSDGGRNYIDFS
jgi:hypothetical protein